MIINIKTEKLFPHPDNPRKDLGDLVELTASIKANGILQNLTVVPKDMPWYKTLNDDSKHNYLGDYFVVIGNRRLAAALRAGLEEIPCAVSDMDLNNQIATMLLENIQRNDLTIYEQAHGFQMMLDLGETIKTITDKTGLSYITVKRRVNLLELDQDKLRESVERGATIQDYIEINKLENVENKNSVLDKIGTQNFNYALREALDNEKWENDKIKIIAELETFAVRADSTDGLFCITSYSKHNDKNKVVRPAEPEGASYYFTVSDYYIYLYRNIIPEEEQESDNFQRVYEKDREIRSELEEITQRAYNLRRDFIRDFSGTKKYRQAVEKFILQALMNENYDFNDELFLNMLDIEYAGGTKDMPYNQIYDVLEKSPERVLLIASYCRNDDPDWGYYDWDGKFEGNPELDNLYDILEELGYEMSDDERALSDGTHKLYVQ